MSRAVVLRALARDGTVPGGEIVLHGSPEGRAVSRLLREHPGCRIERVECDSISAAEHLLYGDNDHVWRAVYEIAWWSALVILIAAISISVARLMLATT